MVEPSKLPVSITQGAFRAPNGEYAWRKADLLHAAQQLLEHRFAIVGGEVWVVEGNLFSPLAPGRDGGWAVFAWHVADQQPDEGWERFARRCMDEILAKMRELDPEASVLPEAAAKMYYHLSFTDERSYILAHTPATQDIQQHAYR